MMPILAGVKPMLYDLDFDREASTAIPKHSVRRALGKVDLKGLDTAEMNVFVEQKPKRRKMLQVHLMEG